MIFVYNVLVLFLLIFLMLFGILFFGWILSQIATIKLSRGFEALSSLNTPYYRGVKKEEIEVWDTLEVSHRKLIH